MVIMYGSGKGEKGVDREYSHVVMHHQTLQLAKGFEATPNDDPALGLMY